MRLVRKSTKKFGLRSVTITVNGERLFAVEGESIASALLSNGIEVFGSSIQSGSPHAPFCFMGTCQACALRTNDRWVLACETRIKEGMLIKTSTCKQSDARV